MSLEERLGLDSDGIPDQLSDVSGVGHFALEDKRARCEDAYWMGCRNYTAMVLTRILPSTMSMCRDTVPNVRLKVPALLVGIAIKVIV